MEEEPTYTLSQEPLYDPFERELRQTRAYLDFALESYENKLPRTAMDSLGMANSHLAGADCELRRAMDESKYYRNTDQENA